VIDEGVDLNGGLVAAFDLIVTGSSPTSDIEHRLWREARALGKKSVCLLDMAKLCRERFQKHGELVFPDLIVVVDEEAAAAVHHLGVSRERIVVAGSPYLAAVSKFKIADEEKRQVREELQLGGKQLITFCTEYIAAAGETEEYGYNEFQILENLGAYIGERGRDGLFLRIRLHPRDEKVLYEDFFKGRADGINWSFEEGDTAYRFLQAADAVVGMTSTILTEAHLLGLPVISFQPVGPGKAPHIHNRLIADNLVTTAAGLYERLDAVLTGYARDAASFPLTSGDDPINVILEQLARALSE